MKTMIPGINKHIMHFTDPFIQNFTLVLNSSPIPSLILENKKPFKISYINGAGVDWFGISGEPIPPFLYLVQEKFINTSSIFFEEDLNNFNQINQSLTFEINDKFQKKWGTVSINTIIQPPNNKHLFCQILDTSALRSSITTLNEMCFYDSLTNLYNRNYFHMELKRNEGGRAFPISFIFIDADNLKYINDSFGHEKGDELLCNIAGILQKCFRKEDVVARIGGDEFVVFLPNCNKEQVNQAICRVDKRLKFFNKNNPANRISFSVGWATANKGDDLISALNEADINMLKNKRKRKTQLLFTEKKN
ncbi:MAG: hypothetical protein CL609_23490 [Anaerolineaceae bacterium]|nr:hypothetical protein [Anaerolineaceae bacterium]